MGVFQVQTVQEWCVTSGVVGLGVSDGVRLALPSCGGSLNRHLSDFPQIVFFAFLVVFFNFLESYAPQGLPVGLSLIGMS